MAICWPIAPWRSARFTGLFLVAIHTVPNVVRQTTKFTRRLGARRRRVRAQEATGSGRAAGFELGSADLAEQAAQKPDELHRRAEVADTLLYPALGVLERRHRVVHDAQVVLPRDLALGLADAK